MVRKLMSSMSSPDKPKPAARRRKNDRSEIRTSFLPEGNGAAKWAYICVVAGLCPGVGLLTGIPAIILGFVGRIRAKKKEDHPGLGHAVVSMAFGAFELITQGVGAWLLLG